MREVDLRSMKTLLGAIVHDHSLYVQIWLFIRVAPMFSLSRASRVLAFSYRDFMSSTGLEY